MLEVDPSVFPTSKIAFGFAPGASQRSASELLAGIGYVPDASCAVVRNEHAAVFRDCDTYGPAPDLSLFGYKSREKVFVASVGVAVVHRNADDLFRFHEPCSAANPSPS